MPWSETVPQLSTVATVLALVLLGYAAVGAPLLGWWAFRRLRRRHPEDPAALTRFYTLTVVIQWAWTAAVAVIVLTSPRFDAADLGLRLPDNLLPLLAALLGFAVVLVALWFLDRNARKGRRPPEALAPRPGGPEATAWAVLVPRSRKERRVAGGAAITVGICEELLYRGLLVALGVSFGLPVWVAAVLAVVLFAVAHAYQGWWGLVGPGALGALLMVLYLGTGSLFIPILLHLGLDMRSLLLRGRGRRHRASAAV